MPDGAAEIACHLPHSGRRRMTWRADISAEQHQ
jgi:hypothetical protein